ncbi:MAG: SpoIIE family protein phosphatase [Bacteroidales bacterium]|nr:SpoIIE family protein phosphatase [Bacteroidales bacterium]
MQDEKSASDYEMMAQTNDSLGGWDETLRNYLRAAEAYRKPGDRVNEARILNIIAGNYYRKGIFKKAALYYEQEYALYEKHNAGSLASSAENAGKSYFNLPLDSLSAVWYGIASDNYGLTGDATGTLRCRERLGQLYTQLGMYEEGLTEYENLIAGYMGENDFKNVAAIYNQTGFLMFKKNDINNALANFNKAVEFSEKAGSDDYFLTDAWSNKAICFQNLENENEMMISFRRALECAKNSGRRYEAARIERIMAMIYFSKKDNYHAEVYCQSCIESAKASGNYDVLHLCYKDYSAVLESGNDFIKALEYYEKHLNLRDSINYANRLAEKESADMIAEYDAIEQRIRDEIATQEIQDLELKTLRAENQRRENEINLLTKQQELERSEKDRIAQSLLLEKEKNIARENQEKVRSLEQEALIQQQELDLKTAREKTLTTENELLETQKKQEAESAQKARQIRNMAIFLGALMVLVAIMILFGLISTRKKNQILAESKRHIEKINADLEQINAEVLKQKDIIEQKNQSITDSIQYASRIQTAVLPPINFLDEWGLENFILFKPKDIVSGDFYWGVMKNEKIMIAAVDCTGHGVPGAFMSMLGHTFLDEIINTREIDNAAAILNILREEIINTLKQKGTTGEARDGMDVSLVILDLKSGKLDYAGANNPLYLIRDGKLTRYKADSMPIGIHFISFTPFTNQIIQIRKGDYFYLFSDGYADQFGGPRGKKFMYKPFQDLLVRNSFKPMELQKEILDNTFEKWKNEREQVDDVMVIGIKV